MICCWGREAEVRTVLVGVRTAAAAQAITAFADRLGAGSLVRTGVSSAEIAARLRERSADVVLLDTALTRPDSAGMVRRLLSVAPGTSVVLLGAEDAQVAGSALAAGARGVIRGGDDLVTAVAKGLLLLLPGTTDSTAARSAAPPAPTSPAGPPALAPLARPSATLVEHDPLVPAQRADVAPPAPVLTERELQVLRGMADGRSNAEIGKELFVSEDTVKTHARRLFRKLGARDRAHAVAAGFRAGLVH